MGVVNLHGDPSPKPGYYILDSNIWLPILGLEEGGGVHYKIFFDKLFKTDNCKILLCPIQLSEILNKLLRFHARKLYDQKYKDKTGAKPKFVDFYKQDYRGGEDFKKKYEIIIDDLAGYESHIAMVDVKGIDYATLTTFSIGNVDFNDHYLCLLAKETGATIVTHDGDFFNTDVNVATFNLKLYNQSKDNIKPILGAKLVTVATEKPE